MKEKDENEARGKIGPNCATLRNLNHICRKWGNCISFNIEMICYNEYCALGI